MRRMLLALVVACGCVLSFAHAADAHATLSSSDPNAGALLDEAPAAISLTFTEPPDPDLSEILVLDESGAELDTPDATTHPGNVLRAPLPNGLPEGVYTVSWRAVSEVDGHLTASAFAFGVGVDPASVPEIPQQATTPPPSVITVAGRALLYAGIAILIGAAVVGGRAFGGVVPRRKPVLIGASAALGLGIVLMVFAEAAAVDVGVVELFQTRTGRPYALLAAIVIITATAGMEAAIGSNRVALTVAGVGAAAAALVRSLGGHAAAAPTPPPQVALQWIHVLAVSVWIGGLVMLALRARTADERLSVDARRFSSFAVVAAPVAVVAGALRATAELGGPGWFLRAFDTAYGTTLAIKLAVVAGLLALGGWNRFRGIGRLESGGGASPLHRVIVAEIALAAAVFGLTGTLTGLPPRPDPASAATPAGVVVRATNFASTVEIVLRATPGTAGPNRFSVRVLDPASGAPLDAEAVTLRFEPLGLIGVPPSTLELASERGAWQAEGANLSIAGTWEVRATVRRGAEGVEVPLVLTTAPPQARVTTSAAPGLPTLTTWTLPDGVSLQMYLDPSDPGTSQTHVTAFDPSGRELPLETATFVAFPPRGSPTVLVPERLSEGHFVATVELVPGRWRFAITATGSDGLLQTSFSRTIGAA